MYIKIVKEVLNLSNRSRAHVNTWAQINTRVQHSKEINTYVKHKRGSYKCLVNTK